jgi:transcriptional regulator with XRE-family HTH domain
MAGYVDFEPPWEAAFSATVAPARVEKGMSQEELARRMRTYGLPANAYDVQNIELGVQGISLNEALVISKVLEMELPVVTLSVRAELVTQSYAQTFGLAKKDWDKIVANLAQYRHQVEKALDNAERVSSNYRRAMERANGECDPELLVKMDALIDTISNIQNSIDEMDRHLGGALSRPPAALPGSQS